MSKILSIILFILCFSMIEAQSPHGEKYIDCGDCHNSFGWAINIDTSHFVHDTMEFDLIGMHQNVDCRDCHVSLVFDEVSADCITCHDDMHNRSVGTDCKRCHTTEDWLVDIIPELHEENGFPLIGPHVAISCVECHISENNNQFFPIGNDCVNCHLEDYERTSNPNHSIQGFSRVCNDCHEPFSLEWDLGGHAFFPLTNGHNIQDCNRCHTPNEFTGLSSECIACHQNDYNNASTPNHSINNFSQDCTQCHTTEVGWKSEKFDNHDDLYFPIYSGKHRGKWNDCMDCHTSGSFASFSCIECHEHSDKGDLDEEHDDVGGYQYESNACYKCHPNGDE